MSAARKKRVGKMDRGRIEEKYGEGSADGFWEKDFSEDTQGRQKSSEN